MFFTHISLNCYLPDYLACITPELREKNEVFYHWEDRYAHLFDQVLLLDGFFKYELNRKELVKSKYGFWS